MLAPSFPSTLTNPTSPGRSLQPDDYLKLLSLSEETAQSKCVARFMHYRLFFNALFVHVPKCGGGNIEEILGLNSSCHCTARAFRDANPSSFAATSKFAVVRHPLPRLVSLFEYARAGDIGGSQDFGAFVAGLDEMSRRSAALRFFLRPQSFFLTDSGVRGEEWEKSSRRRVEECSGYLRETGCGWTAANACPDQRDDAKGVASDDGSLGFRCCCGDLAVAADEEGGGKLLVDHLLNSDDIEREWPLLRRQLPGLPALGASAEFRHHHSANHTWCEYYLTQPALQQAVYQYYRVDYELLQFDHPLPLTHACSGRARSRLGTVQRV